jgi:hypothetical protein
MSFIDNIVLQLKRVAKPHEILARTVKIYVGFLAILFVLLVLIRYYLNEVGRPPSGDPVRMLV